MGGEVLDRMDFMTTVSALARALLASDYPREAVVEAIILSVEVALDSALPDPGDDDITERVGEVFDRLGMHTADHGGGYGLAQELVDARSMIRALETGADPRWFVDHFYGETETLRNELIERARADWKYLIDHLLLSD